MRSLREQHKQGPEVQRSASISLRDVLNGRVNRKGGPVVSGIGGMRLPRPREELAGMRWNRNRHANGGNYPKGWATGLEV